MKQKRIFEEIVKLMEIQDHKVASRNKYMAYRRQARTTHMDPVLLVKIANNVFLQGGGASPYAEYDVDWKTLSALARTCKALRIHLYGLRQLFHNLSNGYDTKALPKRWGFEYSDLRRGSPSPPSPLSGPLWHFFSPMPYLLPKPSPMEIDLARRTKKPKFKRPSLPQPRPRIAIYRQARAEKRARD